MHVKNNRLHFIWLGEQELIDENRLDQLKRWYVKNPGFEIFLWVDPISLHKEITPQILENNLPARYHFIQIKDINKEKIVSAEIRYELDRLQANQIAASNLLRLSILAIYGGYFFEFDLDPDHSIHDESHLYNKRHAFKVSALYQGREQIHHKALFSTPLDPSALHSVLHTHNNYQYPLEEKWNDATYYNQYDQRTPNLSNARKIITDCRTGKNALHSSLFLLGHIQVNDHDEINTYGKRIDYLKKYYSHLNTFVNTQTLFKHFHLSPKIYQYADENNLSQYTTQIKACSTLKEVLDRLTKTMLFEIKELGMIRDLKQMVYLAKRALFNYYREQQKSLVEKYFYNELKQIPRLLPSSKDHFIDNYIRALLNHFSEIKYDRDLINQDFSWLKHDIKIEKLSEVKVKVEINFLKKFMKQFIIAHDNAFIQNYDLSQTFKQLLQECSSLGHTLKYDNGPLSYRDIRTLLEYIDYDQNHDLDESIQASLLENIATVSHFHHKASPEAYLSELMYYITKRKVKENADFTNDLSQSIHHYRRRSNIMAEDTKHILYMLEQYLLLNQDERISQGAIAQFLRIIIAHMKKNDYANSFRKTLTAILEKHEAIRTHLYLIHPLFKKKLPLDQITQQRLLIKKFRALRENYRMKKSS